MGWLVDVFCSCLRLVCLGCWFGGGCSVGWVGVFLLVVLFGFLLLLRQVVICRVLCVWCCDWGLCLCFVLLVYFMVMVIMFYDLFGYALLALVLFVAYVRFVGCFRWLVVAADTFVAFLAFGACFCGWVGFGVAILGGFYRIALCWFVFLVWLDVVLLLLR